MMSLVDREVDVLLQDASEMRGTTNEEVVANAVKEVCALFQASHNSFEAICAEIEGGSFTVSTSCRLWSA